MESIAWLQQWYLSKCDGEWEFSTGIKILSVSNPGWSVEIDVTNTQLEGIRMPFKLIRNSDSDWYGYLVEDNLFIGSGDPSKLSYIIELFKKIV